MKMDAPQPSEVRLHLRVAEQERMVHAGRVRNTKRTCRGVTFLEPMEHGTLHAPTIPASASFSASTLRRDAGGSATRRKKPKQEENGTVSAFERTFSTVSAGAPRRGPPFGCRVAAGSGRTTRRRCEMLARQDPPFEQSSFAVNSLLVGPAHRPRQRHQDPIRSSALSRVESYRRRWQVGHFELHSKCRCKMD
jgi:hypothetical protein